MGIEETNITKEKKKSEKHLSRKKDYLGLFKNDLHFKFLISSPKLKPLVDISNDGKNVVLS